eukprot:Awhi_evm2s6513
MKGDRTKIVGSPLATLTLVDGGLFFKYRTHDGVLNNGGAGQRELLLTPDEFFGKWLQISISGYFQTDNTGAYCILVRDRQGNEIKRLQINDVRTFFDHSESVAFRFGQYRLIGNDREEKSNYRIGAISIFRGDGNKIHSIQ